jgi:NNP family nitrate/nitrite transporter-like MFS transporter
MTAAAAPLRGQLGQVVLATIASTTGFWAWMSISPLQKTYATALGLSETQISLTLATPVLVGALGRVVVGALTDRYGGRKLFTAILLGAMPAVLLVALAGSREIFWLLIVSGFYLGVAGTVFAVGIPFSSAWYEPHRRGLANGVFGMGMVGTAVSAFLTPRLAQWIGYLPTHLLIAGVMVVMAAIVWFFMKDSPAWTPSRQPIWPRISGALKLSITWQMSFLYAVVFGGFVAFSTFLPKYLTTIYPAQVDQIGAGNRMGSFVIAAVIARPIGGILADKLGPKPIAAIALAAVAGLAVIVSFEPPEGIVTGATFLAMAAALGLGMGAVFAWVPLLAPADKVGSVSGVVAAAGGLGGYFPPLVMGATYNAATNSYALGIWLLVVTAALALALALLLRGRRHPEPAEATPAAVE